MKILKSSPWGKVQSHEIVASAGIVFYSTASHGGYKVDKRLNNEIPEIFRAADGWYEEDCAWSIVWVFLSAHFDAGQFKAETFMSAQSTLLQWFPHEWQAYNGVQVVKSDKCWDCAKNTCHATADIYPKEVSNTGYGNYRVLTQEVAPGKVETRVFCQGLIVEVATTGQLNHSLCFDRVVNGYYEKCGNVPALPILAEVGMMTPSQEKFLIHWHLYHDTWSGRKNNAATLENLIKDGWLYEHESHLLVSRKGKEWCDKNHMRFLTSFDCEPKRIA